MKKILLIPLVLMICTLSSCMSVGIDDDTQKRVDAITAEFKRLNNELETFQKDIKDLTEIIKKIVEKFEGKQGDN